MDSPIVTQLFRQLFRHPACQSRRNLTTATLVSPLQHGRHEHHHQQRRRSGQQQHQHQQRQQQRRTMATRGTERGPRPSRRDNEANWQQRTELFSLDMSEEYRSYPMVTANDLRTRRDRPRKVKMLMRDFIEGVWSRVVSGRLVRERPALRRGRRELRGSPID